VTADVDKAVSAAQAALPAWKNTAAKTRQDCMTKLANLLETNAGLLGSAESFAMGQPINLATMIARMSASWWRYYAGWADKVEGRIVTPEHSSGDGALRLIFHDPIGVCAGITAWNGTILTASIKIAPAMAAGCTFVLKSSEKSPFGALLLGKLVKEAGFPPGVINVVSGPGATGQLLAEHMKIQKISFTGSTLAGKQVQAAAARSNLKVGNGSCN
jgi:aldehyde dehydrogenase (NAD+)